MGETSKPGAHAFLVRFSDAVRGLSDARGVAETACRMLVEELASERAHWSEIDWTSREYVVESRFVVDGSEATVGGRYPLEDWEPLTSRLTAGQSVISEDQPTDPALPHSVREGIMQMRIAGRIAVPVMSVGSLRAVLSVNQRSPRRWSAEEIALVEGVAARCWAEVERTRAEAAMRESEQRMQLAMRATRMVTWEWVPALDRITTSDSFADVYGLPALGGAHEGFALVLPEDVEAHVAKVRAIATHGGNYDSEFRIRRPVDGRIAWLEERAEARVGPSGGVERIVGVTLDITARKCAEAKLRATEERQSFLLALSDVLRPLSDAGAIQESAARLVAEHLGCGWAYFGEGDLPLTTMTVKRCHVRPGLPSLVGAFPVSSLILAESLSAGSPVAVSDVTTDPRIVESTRAHFGAVGMRSFAGVPIVKNGVLRAVVVAGDTTERAWSDLELRLLEEVAERTWDALERTRAEEALRESEAKYRTLFETLEDGYALAEPERDASGAVVGYRVLEANGAWARFTRGRMIPSVETVAAVLSTGAPARVETFLEGVDRWIEVRIVPGRERFTCLLSDLTERRETERARRVIEERQAFLLALGDALRPLSDAREIQRVAMRVVGEHLRVDRVLYADFDLERNEYTIADNYVAPGVAPRIGRFPTEAYSSIARRLSRGETTVIPDMTRTSLMSASEREAAVAAGLHAAIGVPLLKGGRLVAQLSVQQLRPRAWSAAEVTLLQETAERTWAAVERARAEEALRHKEEHLRMAMSAARFSSWELDLATPAAASDRSAPLEHIREEVLEEDAARLSAAVQATIDGRGDLHTEYRAKDPGTGETMWFESHATRVGGHLGRVSGITRDVTDQKRAEEDRRRGAAHQTFLLELSDALRTAPDAMGIKAETTRRLRAHLDVAWCAYARIDPTGAVATIVREAARPGLASLLGVHALPRRPEIAELLGAGDVLAIPDLAKPGALDPGQAERYTALGMRGALAVPLLQEARPAALLLVADTRPRAWTGGEIDLVRDVAERTWIAVGRARAEAALRASEARLQLADRAKDDFLATLGHELRTPLAAILLWGEALRSGKLPSGDHPRALEAIVECAKAQSILIDDLLDLSRLVTGKLRLSPESVDVAEVARGLDAIVRPMAVAKGVALIADVAPDLGRVEIDVSRLRQVLWNLLSNAIKFTPAGGTVTSTVQRRDGYLELVVADTGEGFGPAFAEHLFERFRQADMGESRRHGGLGIGLALSRELVELQGGTITAESAGPGKGATFCARLPWVPGRASSGAPPLARGSARSVTPPPLAGVTVVLAEDEPHTRAAMESALEQAGATVLGVSSGKAALEALAAVDAASTPVVLVSDLGLPGMTGYELVAQAAAERAARGEAPLPACAVSSHARDTDRRRAIDAGFDIYVAKPVMPDDLVEAVADLVPMTRG